MASLVEKSEGAAKVLDGSAGVDETSAGTGAEPDVLLRKFIPLLDKRFLKNQEMRINFADKPEKFMASELNLLEAVEDMRAVVSLSDSIDTTSCPQLLARVLDLLSHENADVKSVVMQILQMMVEKDPQGFAEETVGRQVVKVLVAALERSDEGSPAEVLVVRVGLSVIDALLELNPDTAEESNRDLLTWLLRRLRWTLGTENRVHASIVLSMLLQNSEFCRQVLGQLQGIDVLLQVLAPYRTRNPGTPFEVELMENAFNCLCWALHKSSQNKALFLVEEGVQLMNLMLKGRMKTRLGAVRVLNYATSGPDGSENCNAFVDVLGLRTVFPLYVKPPPPREVFEEHVLSIISNMLKNCDGVQKLRLLNKFLENDLEKVDRLMELHLQYLEKVYSDEESEFGKESLFILQMVDFILLEICSSGSPQIKQRVMTLLYLHGGSAKTVKLIMREYVGSLGDAEDSAQKILEEQRILRLIDKF